MPDIQAPPEKPTERYYRLSRENFAGFLKQVGFRERKDRRWERSRRESLKDEIQGVADEPVVLDIDKLFRNKRKLQTFIRYHWCDLPPFR